LSAGKAGTDRAGFLLFIGADWLGWTGRYNNSESRGWTDFADTIDERVSLVCPPDDRRHLFLRDNGHVESDSRLPADSRHQPIGRHIGSRAKVLWSTSRLLWHLSPAEAAMRMRDVQAGG
jgi:hypothetical protein